jgi:hypothetical protein
VIACLAGPVCPWVSFVKLTFIVIYLWWLCCILHWMIDVISVDQCFVNFLILSVVVVCC